MPKRQNRPATVPPPAWPAFNAFVAARREAPTLEAGPRRQQALLAQSHDTFPEACRCLADEAAARLPPRKVPARPRQAVRTAHLAERAWAEERRRPTVLPPRWEEARGVPWGFAVLSRVRERWGTPQWREFAQHPMRALRHTVKLEHPWVPLEALPKERSPRRSAASAQEFYRQLRP